jgi:hypothetical protein
MRSLSTQQFYAAAGTNAGTFGARTNRQETALAFGIERRLAGGKLLDLDAAAMILVDELTPAFGRRYAATIVRAHSDTWLKGVGRADTMTEPMYFLVAEYGEPIKGATHAIRNSMRVAVATFGEFKDYNDPKAHFPARVTMVNISNVLKRVRANAAKVGVDLSGPFFPPPTDPLAKELIATAKKQREKALALYFERMAATKESVVLQ